MAKNIKLCGIFKDWCHNCGGLTFWDWFHWKEGSPPTLRCLVCGQPRLFVKFDVSNHIK